MQYSMQNNRANIVLETELGEKNIIIIIIIAHVQLHLFKSNWLNLKTLTQVNGGKWKYCKKLI